MISDYIVTLSYIGEEEKKINEQYVVRNAVSCGDAEETAIKYIQEYVCGDIESKSSKKIEVSAVLNPHATAGDDSVFWYMAKVQCVTIDETSGKETNRTLPILVAAISLPDALRTVEESFRDSIYDHETLSLTKTKIIGVVCQAS
jgi:hypothetical protein